MYNVEYAPRGPVYYVYFIITFLILIFLIYRNLFHNILKNCNTRYRNQQVYQFYMFTFIKFSL